MGIFPVLLIYGYREVTSTYDISWSFWNNVNASVRPPLKASRGSNGLIISGVTMTAPSTRSMVWPWVIYTNEPWRRNDTWKVKGISTLKSGNASSTEKFEKTTIYKPVSNNPNLLFIFTGNTGMYSPLGGRILHLMSPSYCCISVKPSVTISGCPMGIFPVLLIYGYRQCPSKLIVCAQLCVLYKEQSSLAQRIHVRLNTVHLEHWSLINRAYVLYMTYSNV
jgi:hypothetical protein